MLVGEIGEGKGLLIAMPGSRRRWSVVSEGTSTKALRISAMRQGMDGDAVASKRW